MVKRTIERVKAALSRKSATKSEITRRLLLVVQFYGSTYVLQGEQQIHQKHHCFREEAERTFQRAFKFVRRSDVQVGKVFQRDHVEWHPIIFPLAEYHLSDDLLTGENTDLTGLVVVPLARHQFHEQLKRYDQELAIA